MAGRRLRYGLILSILSQIQGGDADAAMRIPMMAFLPHFRRRIPAPLLRDRQRILALLPHALTRGSTLLWRWWYWHKHGSSGLHRAQEMRTRQQ